MGFSFISIFHSSPKRISLVHAVFHILFINSLWLIQLNNTVDNQKEETEHNKDHNGKKENIKPRRFLFTHFI